MRDSTKGEQGGGDLPVALFHFGFNSELIYLCLVYDFKGDCDGCTGDETCFCVFEMSLFQIHLKQHFRKGIIIRDMAES